MSDFPTHTSEELHQRLAEASLYILIGGQTDVADLRALAMTLVQAGVHVLQLRDKSLSDRELLERARILRRVTDSTNTLFIVNDRPDLAFLAEADGVHVGQEEFSIDDARRIVGPKRLIGVSTHTLEQARQAVADGASYLGCGPTFPSETKTFSSFAGTDFLSQVAKEVRLPAFAIGGIGLSNLDAVIRVGFHRVAIGSAVAEADDPAAQARQILRRLGNVLR
ncbi:MAG: thiamine phosphate synthase [Pirellulaceae bacterium]